MDYSFTRVWKSRTSLEVFTMEISREGVIAGGMISNLFATEKAQFLSYRICLDHAFDFKSLQVKNLKNNNVLIWKRNEVNAWYDGENRRLNFLDGCQSIDLSCTPFTSSLPILAAGCQEGRPLKIAKLNSSNLIIEPHEQVYKRIDNETYRYELVNGQNKAIAELDNCGIVTKLSGFITLYAAESPAILAQRIYFCPELQ